MNYYGKLAITHCHFEFLLLFNGLAFFWHQRHLASVPGYAEDKTFIKMEPEVSPKFLNSQPIIPQMHFSFSYFSIPPPPCCFGESNRTPSPKHLEIFIEFNREICHRCSMITMAAFRKWWGGWKVLFPHWLLSHSLMLYPKHKLWLILTVVCRNEPTAYITHYLKLDCL